MKTLPLRPSIKNPLYWRGDKLKQDGHWVALRKEILHRDNSTCRFCGHYYVSHMHVHHLGDEADSSKRNLATTCVACHAVHHLGRNLGLGCIEIWKSQVKQVEIVRLTRSGIEEGKTLLQINKTFSLVAGPHPPAAMENLKMLIDHADDKFNRYLPTGFIAVFVKFKLWQLTNPKDVSTPKLSK